MANRSYRETGKPENRQAPSAHTFDWDPFRGLHQGQRSADRTKQAGHMTAPDRNAKAPTFSLQQRGRPHMTIFDDDSGVFPDRSFSMA
jgi:hypothetical protein